MRISAAIIGVCVLVATPVVALAQTLPTPDAMRQRILKLAHDTKGVSGSCVDLLERTGGFYLEMDANRRVLDFVQKTFGKDDPLNRPYVNLESSLTKYRTRIDPFVEEALTACQPRRKSPTGTIDAMSDRLDAMETEYFAFSKTKCDEVQRLKKTDARYRNIYLGC